MSKTASQTPMPANISEQLAATSTFPDMTIAGSSLRLQTAVRLRWIAVTGQLLAIGFVYVGLGYDLPVGLCLTAIALSAWLNILLRILYPTRHRVDTQLATVLLAYDLAQLTALLYLTGGVVNPFVFMLVAPVTVSASTQPTRSTLFLAILTGAAVIFLMYFHRPLPWNPAGSFSQPLVYKTGVAAAVFTAMAFLALYAWRLAREAQQMSAALAATEHVLAREQRLHALDGLAAAAAHELGTPLATITVIAKELSRDVAKDSPLADDLALLQSQAVRCREILQTLTTTPVGRDPMHAHLTISQLIDEAARPYIGLKAKVVIDVKPAPDCPEAFITEPEGERLPGMIHGLGNLIENAVDFATTTVNITGRWNGRDVAITVSDDGPGFSADIIESLGEPYITTRNARTRAAKEAGAASGLGLGFFIAKTLLERSGARLILENRNRPGTGAIVNVAWPRQTFENSGRTGWRVRAAAKAI